MTDHTKRSAHRATAEGEPDRKTLAAQHKLLLKGIVGRHEAEFGELFTRDTLRHYVEDSYDELSSRAKVMTHVPSFVDRFSRQRLRALAKNQTKITDHPTEVLFVCQRNDAASQIAAALFNHAAGGRGSACSAGTAPAPEVIDEVVYVMHEIGIDLLGEFPKPLTTEVEQAADVIVTLDAHDDIEVIDDKRYFAWRLPDRRDEGLDGYRELRTDLSQRIDELIDMVLPPAPHPTRVALERATATLEADISRMGELVIGLGERLGPALHEGDPTKRHAILEGDDEIDDLEKEILRSVVEAIARHQPVATDLRSILACHDIALHLERIADGIVDVAAISGGEQLAVDARILAMIIEMAELVANLTQDALAALASRNVELAQQVGVSSRDLERLADDLSDLLTSARGSTEDKRHIMDVVRAGRILQRCGGHAVDIAEQALFLITGELRELGRETIAPRSTSGAAPRR